MAVVARVFGEYLFKAVVVGGDVGGVVVKAVGLLGVWGVTVGNWRGRKAGADFANGFLVVKLGALVVITGTGIGGAVGVGVGSSPSGGWFGREEGGEMDVGERMGRFVTAMFAALFSYNGFESVSLDQGEGGSVVYMVCLRDVIGWLCPGGCQGSGAESAEDSAYRHDGCYYGVYSDEYIVVYDSVYGGVEVYQHAYNSLSPLFLLSRLMLILILTVVRKYGTRSGWSCRAVLGGSYIGPRFPECKPLRHG